MKLAKKLIVTQIVVSFIIILVGCTMIPYIIVYFFGNQNRQQVTNLSSQIMQNVDQRFEELQRFSKVVECDQKLGDYLNDYFDHLSNADRARISLHLSNVVREDGLSSYQIYGIYLKLGDSSGSEFTTVGFSGDTASYLQKNVIPEFDSANQTEQIISPFKCSGDSNSMFGNNFSRMYGYIRKTEIDNIPATIVFISPYDEIMNIVKKSDTFCDDFILTDMNNKNIEPSVASSGIDIDNIFANIKYGSSYKEGYVINTDGFTTVSISSLGNWKLLCRLTRDDMIRRNMAIFYFVVLSIVVFSAITIIVMVILTKNLMKPLQNVSDKMSELAAGDLSVRIDKITNDEVGAVAVSFNIMADQLSSNIKSMIEKEKVEQRLRYNLLISQINPHFIYNTMNTVTYLATQNRCTDIIAVNKALIDILRDRLSIKIDDVYSTVGQEIDVIKKYLVIQDYRFSGTFKTNISISSECADCYVVKNILQPLVENSLMHGILNNKDEDGDILGGCITICAEIVGNNRMQLVVSDNGAGMSRETLNEIMIYGGDESDKNSKHIGLWNIHERLKYIYHGEAKMNITSKEGEGTEVVLEIPVSREKT